MNSTDVPAKYRKLYERAMSGKSRNAAIRAHCLMCMGWRASDVPNCTAPTCPLYSYRAKKRAATPT